LFLEFHEFGGSGASLVFEDEDDGGESGEDVDQFEVEVGEGLEAALEIGAEGGDASDGACGVVEEFGGRRRGEDDVLGIVEENAVGSWEFQAMIQAWANF